MAESLSLDTALPTTIWYLVCGKTGAGKSTVSRELSKQHGALVFSIDEWMNTLFWQDCPEKNDYPWAIERVRRCEEQIFLTARAAAARRISCVLDLGFTQAEQRLQWLARAKKAGVSAELIVVDPPAEVRWQRVCERNAGASETFSFHVTREMFDAMEAMWESVMEEERAGFRSVLFLREAASEELHRSQLHRDACVGRTAMSDTTGIFGPPGSGAPPDNLQRLMKLAQPDSDDSLEHIGIVGDTYTLLLAGDDTAGQFCLIDMHIPPGGGPPPHRHDFEETFIVLDGELTATFRGEQHTVRAGDTLHIPANAPHQFHNGSDKPARTLCLCSPAGQENMFRELGVRLPTRTTPPPPLDEAAQKQFMEKAKELAPRYRTELLQKA